MTDQPAAARKDFLIGFMLLMATAVLWSLNGALIKLIHDDGRGPGGVTIAFYRSLFAGLFLFPLARGNLHTLRRDRSKPALGRRVGRADETPSVQSLLGSGRRWHSVGRLPFVLRPAAVSCVFFFTLMTACFVLANIKTEAANAIILQYTSTFWIFVLSPLLLGEKPRARDLWLLVLAMIGIAIIFAGEAGTDLAGLLIALASGLFYALLTLMIRQMRDSDSAAVTVVNNIGSAMLLLPVTLIFGSLVLSPRSAGLLIFMGVVQFGIPYYLYTLALVRVPAYQAALMTLAEPVLNPLWAYLAVGDPVPVTTFIGGGIILAALVLFIVLTARKRRAVSHVAPGH